MLKQMITLKLISETNNNRYYLKTNPVKKNKDLFHLYTNDFNYILKNPCLIILKCIGNYIFSTIEEYTTVYPNIEPPVLMKTEYVTQTPGCGSRVP